MVPSAEARRRAKSAELARLRRERYEAKRNDKSHGKGKGSHHTQSRFVFWDGEGPQDAGYALFGNSDGLSICSPYLRTEDCLSLILDSKSSDPDTIFVAFGFNYDVSNIMRECSWRHLSALHHYGRTVWHDYEIEHIPHKWFRVRKNGISATIFDVRSYFSGGFHAALEEFEIGTADERERISSGKAARDRFYWKDMPEIRLYWGLELSLGVLLCDRLRELFSDAGYVPRSWHGPGALARMALRRHRVYDAMSECPPDIQTAARYAFAGGRFQLRMAGHIKGPVYVKDINSAYPYYATMLPNLARGHWRYSTDYDSDRAKFGVWHISYHSKPDPYRLYPLFCRLPDDSVVWPHKVTGWYWNPEADLVADDPDATFIEGWVFDEDDPTDRPFAWLAEYFERKKRLKKLGSPAYYTFKVIINAVYGQLAQRTGWDRKRNLPPRSHQLEWAGWITSACRAAIYRLAIETGEDKIISLDTDGVSATCPLASVGTGSGTELGQWEESEYSDGIFWQSGIYCLKTENGWDKARTRGIPKGTYDVDELFSCLRADEPLRLTKRMFVTYGLADSGRRAEINTWKDEPHEFVLGGNGKTLHFRSACRSVCSGDLHKLGAPLFLWKDVEHSKAHFLPWLDRSVVNRNKQLIDDWTFYSVDDPELETWVRSYGD